MQPLAPILTSDLFPDLRQELLDLLDSLTPDDWLAPTTPANGTPKMPRCTFLAATSAIFPGAAISIRFPLPSTTGTIS